MRAALPVAQAYIERVIGLLRRWILRALSSKGVWNDNGSRN